MTTHQFFVQRSRIGADRRVRLGDADAYHIRIVLRLKKNGVIRLVDDEQITHRAVLERVAADGVYARIIESSPAVRPGCRLTVVQGIPRLTKVDLIVQKLTELGVAGIILAPMEYTPYPDGVHRVSRRHERLRRIAESAAKQCGRGDIPDVRVHPDLESSLGEFGPDAMLLVADESAPRRRLRDCLKEAPTEACPALFIGPEGGISPTERNILKEAGARPFSLGRTILRTETAAIVAAALVLYELGDI
jgi:16S rRNA (uracil1498-N3)-methyltransferase